MSESLLWLAGLSGICLATLFVGIIGVWLIFRWIVKWIDRQPG